MPDSDIKNAGLKITLPRIKVLQVLEHAEYLFDFIRRHPRVFPGFFLYDYHNNVKPKQRIVHRQRRLVFRDLKKVRIGDYEDVDL